MNKSEKYFKFSQCIALTGVVGALYLIAYTIGGGGADPIITVLGFILPIASIILGIIYAFMGLCAHNKPANNMPCQNYNTTYNLNNNHESNGDDSDSDN